MINNDKGPILMCIKIIVQAKAILHIMYSMDILIYMMVQSKCHEQNHFGDTVWQPNRTVSKYRANRSKSANLVCFDLKTLVYVIQDVLKMVHHELNMKRFLQPNNDIVRLIWKTYTYR